MKGALLNQLTITDETAARILTDIDSVRRLEPFMKRDVTLSEAAEELGLKLPHLLYHVNRFIKLGLLRVTHEQKRSGRAVKLYRTTAEVFFVPFRVTPSETLERLLYDLSTPQEKLFYREATRVLQKQSPTWGLAVSYDSDGIRVALTPHEDGHVDVASTFFSPDAEALFATDGTLKLDFQTAKAFQKDLYDLYKRYNEKQHPKGQTYALRFGLTPVEDES